MRKTRTLRAYHHPTACMPMRFDHCQTSFGAIGKTWPDDVGTVRVECEQLLQLMSGHSFALTAAFATHVEGIAKKLDARMHQNNNGIFFGVNGGDADPAIMVKRNQLDTYRRQLPAATKLAFVPSREAEDSAPLNIRQEPVECLEVAAPIPDSARSSLFANEVMKTSANKEYTVLEQHLRAGSHCHDPDDFASDEAGGFQLAQTASSGHLLSTSMKACGKKRGASSSAIARGLVNVVVSAALCVSKAMANKAEAVRSMAMLSRVLKPEQLSDDEIAGLPNDLKELRENADLPVHSSYVSWVAPLLDRCEKTIG